jgi:NADH-quinone oxidoreductase subunit M
MNPLNLAWVETAIGAAILGSIVLSLIREPRRAYRWGLGFTGFSFVCTLLAWLSYYIETPVEVTIAYSLQPRLFGRMLFSLDELSGPLLPTIGLLHFLTALATPQASMRRFSFSWSLCAEAMRLATFSCREPWVLVGLLAAATIPPYVELVNRGRPVRVYTLHMALFVLLLVLGWSGVATAADMTSIRAQLGTVLLMAAVLVRCGTIPVHCWVADWFEHSSFGIALLYMVPLSGVYVAVRLVLPIAPEWVLRSISLMSLATAVYASGLAIVQRETRRFYACLFLSQASLVLVGLELQTPLSLAASLCLWFSAILSLAGFGLVLRGLEKRFGRLSLTRFHGLYSHSPTLAVCFLLSGLTCIGFPATVGFISTELLVDSALEVNSLVGIAVLAATTLNGIAIVRAYLRLFTGAKHASTLDLEIRPRERIAVLTLVALILGGGIFPQPGIISRFTAARRILEHRAGARPAQALSRAAGEESRKWEALR